MDIEIKKKLPIGVDNFEKIRTEGFYYIDKTELIKELLYNHEKINLITRPRRFGKSLNMSMLKSFFQISTDKGHTKDLFDGLNISDDRDLCKAYMGEFPVISISLKGVNGTDFSAARSMMSSIIGNEALRFYFLSESPKLNEKEKKQFDQLTEIDESNCQGFVMSDTVLISSLKVLSMLLQKHYEKKVIILIDEYDVPLAKAFDNGYYDEMVLLIRNLFEQALKTNDSLQFAILTGCLCVSKESIFAGSDNIRISSITDIRFSEYFGFTDKEVRGLLEYYNLDEHHEVIKKWYDGYRFGKTNLYCPWSVICYCDELRFDQKAQPKGYWSNTSNNQVIKYLIDNSDDIVKHDIEYLVGEEMIQKEIFKELTYDRLYSKENIWSILFTTGYLTQRKKFENNVYNLTIPNREIRNIFTQQIAERCKDMIRNGMNELGVLYDAFEKGDGFAVEKYLKTYLKKTINFKDTLAKRYRKENFHSRILLTMLEMKDSWSVWQNFDIKEGYSDIFIEVEDKDLGIIVVAKESENADMVTECRHALHRIEEKCYVEELKELGLKHVVKYGVIYTEKYCTVMVEQES